MSGLRELSTTCGHAHTCSIKRVAMRSSKMLVVLDEYTRQCFQFHVARSINAKKACRPLGGLFRCRGIPGHRRADEGSEFTAAVTKAMLDRHGVKHRPSNPGAPG